MKYIIFDKVGGVFNFPVIFPEIVRHSIVGESMGGDSNILSAGYADYVVDGGVRIAVRDRPSRDYPNKPPVKEVDEAVLSNAVQNY